MPDWVTSVLIAGAAIALIVWLVSRAGVKPGDFLSALLGLDPAERSRAAPPQRTASARQRLLTLIALGVSAVVLMLILQYVFSSAARVRAIGVTHLGVDDSHVAVVDDGPDK